MEICSDRSDGMTVIFGTTLNINRVETSPRGPAVSFIAFNASMSAVL